MIEKKYLVMAGIGILIYAVVVYFVYRNYKKSSISGEVPPSPIPSPIPSPDTPTPSPPAEVPLPNGVSPAPPVPPVPNPSPPIPPVPEPPKPDPPKPDPPKPGPTPIPGPPGPLPPMPGPVLPPKPGPVPTPTGGPPPAAPNAPSAPPSKKWDDCGKGNIATEKDILGFCGEFDWLSNFYPAKVARNGKTFLCAEGAYQAAKFEDKPDIVEKFTKLDGDAAYKLASTLTYDEAAFSKNSVKIMIEIVKSKFSDTNLMKKLKDTGSKNLVEFNWWGNKFWGQSPDGMNWLGRILMYVRDGSWKVY
jgi:ribA/ribD-fused uncharacterized protein